MTNFQINKPEYGDRKRMEDLRSAVPLTKSSAPAGAASPSSEEAEPQGFGAAAPHTQNHLYSANYFLKKAHEPRAKIADLDEGSAKRLQAAQIAVELAERTGDPEVAALAAEIMDGADNPFDYFATLAAAKLDDIDIAEGRFVDVTAERDAGIQGDSANGSGQPKTEKTKSGSSA